MQFPEHAPSANPVFFRTYSRRTEEGRESWDEVCDRTLKGLVELGQLTEEEAELVDRQQRSLRALTSGRWLWVGGTEWVKKPESFFGAYNCSSTSVVDWNAFGLMMNLAMQGCGTGANLEQRLIDRLPPICNRLNITIVREIGTVPKEEREEETSLWMTGDNTFSMVVGDSRQGWVDSYQALMELASNHNYNGAWLEASESIVNPAMHTYNQSISLEIDLGHVRPAGEKLKGFGGVSNPSKLTGLYDRVAKILNGAIGRRLNSVECCLLIDEAAIVVVAGNVRRSAGIRQFASDDMLGATAKDNLWEQDKDGNWSINPDRDALRMANHTRTFHRKPTLGEVKESVAKQFYSGEGAIQYVPEAIARGNADLITNPDLKRSFLDAYINGEGRSWIKRRFPEIDDRELDHRMERYGLNPCLRGDMRLYTTDGFIPISKLVGDNVQLINSDGNETIGRVWKSGLKEIVELVLENGRSLFCTPDHRWMTTEGECQAKDLVGKCLKGAFNASDVLVVECKEAGESEVFDFSEPLTNWGVVEGFVSHNCGEIILNDNLCNLSEIHLNTIDPYDDEAQAEAFKAGALSVASLLNHKFPEERYQYSRLIDPIVGVSFTGLFDFFVKAFGVEWLHWWAAGRPSGWSSQGRTTHYYLSDYFRDKEVDYLKKWRAIVEETVWDYCDRHGIRRPNRCTTTQPAGSKSLLTGASPGWHPPKAARFIRRITFAKNDPVALACLDYGYSIVPSQSDTDQTGKLLNDPFDDRCTEWLVEIPTEVSWANMPGADQVDISQFSANAQFDFYMQVQKHYVGHNTSATIELRSHEIEPLAEAIYKAIENDEGYMSAALLARFDDYQAFPRLPFEPIDKDTYNLLHNEVLSRRKNYNFLDALSKYDRGELEESGPAACDSDKCLFPQAKVK